MSLKETIKAVGYALKNATTKPVTHQYPDEKLVVEKRSRGMLSLDLDNCIGCELCYIICPADAIRMRPVGLHNAWNPRDIAPEIDFNRCIYCGLCSEICPPNVLHHTHVFNIATDNRKDLVYAPSMLKEVYLKEIVPNEDKYERRLPKREPRPVSPTSAAPKVATLKISREGESTEQPRQTPPAPPSPSSSPPQATPQNPANNGSQTTGNTKDNAQTNSSDSAK